MRIAKGMVVGAVLGRVRHWIATGDEGAGFFPFFISYKNSH